ncbi:MAG: phage head closure protein [Lachnospiraceae bacterium]|nr:phage head closure protein [Lachnospiraceae bacterium]
MYINPGQLDKRIEIVQLVSKGTNSNGFPIQPDRRVIRRCFAKVSNTSGSEIVKANSEFAEAKKRFLIRYTDAEINTDMVICYRGKDYDIKYINSYDDDKEYIEIWTELSERS